MKPVSKLKGRPKSLRPLPKEREMDWLQPDPSKPPTSRVERIMATTNSRQEKITKTMPIPDEQPNVTTVYGRKNNAWQVLGWRCLDCEKMMSKPEIVQKHTLACDKTNLINKKEENEIVPIQRIMKNGEPYYRWGDHGKLYKDRTEAEKQAKAAYASGYKEPSKDQSKK